MFSVNTNVGAMIALQNLNATGAALQKTQNAISTGMSVASAQDNGAIWAIAQNTRANSSALDSVTQSLQRAQSAVDVANSAGTSISDILTQMKQKSLAASDTSLDTTSRAALNADYTSLRDQIGKIVSNADFNGTNLLDGSIANIQALANSSGTSTLTVTGQNLSLGGAIVTIGATSSISTAALATTELAKVSASITQVDSALANLGTASQAIGRQITFVGKLQDTLNAGVGNLVNADLAKESAHLQALQTKQQLGVQALSIANSSSSALLGLFR